MKISISICSLFQIDFSHSSIASPGLDLTHLLFTSSQSSVKEPEWEKLLQLYHEELICILKKMNYPKPLPTLASIKHQFRTNGLYPAMIGILEQNNRVLNHEADDCNIVSLFMTPVTVKGDREKRMKVLANPKAAVMTKYLLDYYDKNGYLDIK